MSGLRLDTVSVSLGGRRAVADVSLAVPAGTLLAVVGPNGAGKTSLLRALAGLVPHAGTIRFGGADLGALSAGERARRIGYLPQGADFAWALSVRDAVGLGRLPHGDPFGRLSPGDREAVDEALQRLDLTGFADRAVTALSGGERSRVMLARVLATQAPLLVLDEPTAALDVRHEMELLELIRALVNDGLAGLIITHQLNLAARFADRIVLMACGRVIADGPPGEVFRTDVLESVFEWPLAVTPLPDGTPQATPARRGPGGSGGR
jgi:iron complex transport system ATP-binding protein